MHIPRRTLLVALASVELFVLLAALARPAYGYIDPGSGLLAVQVGGSMLAGALFMVRSKIRKLFRRSVADSQPEAKETPAPNTGD